MKKHSRKFPNNISLERDITKKTDLTRLKYRKYMLSIYIMPTFASLIEKKNLKYKGILKILGCIDDTAEKLGVDLARAAMVLDTYYLGIRRTYDTFSKTGEIWVAFPDGLRHFGDDGSVYTEDISKNREMAQYNLRNMSIGVTGARAGDTVSGITDLSKGGLIKIAEGTVAPSRDDLDNIRMFPELWEVFINKLGVIDFFKEMSIFEREIWLASNEREGEYDFADCKVFIEVMDVGKSSFLTIEQDALAEILAGNREREDRAWDALAVRERFPRKPGSKARRATLVFYLHRWKLVVSHYHTTKFSGPVYTTHMVAGSTLKGEEISIFDGVARAYEETKKGYEVVEKGEIGVVMKVDRDVDYFEVLRSYFKLPSASQIDMVIEGCKNFTAAGYKSLLQKIIRYAPEQVDIRGSLLDAHLVLSVVFTGLLLNPGSFVPDIQRYVTGRESAVKRLLVSILEDSYTDDHPSLLKLAVLSFLAQRINAWRLTKSDFVGILELCGKVLKDRRLFDYNIKKGVDMVPYTVNAESTDLEATSALLDEVKSFETDLGMTRSIAYNKGKPRPGGVLSRPKTMDISHCIDHHWAPDLAYFLSLDIAEDYESTGNAPFAGIFSDIFERVTGVNTRVNTIKEKDKFVLEVREAQKMVILAKQTKPVLLPKIKGTSSYHIDTTLDISWIAGLVGPIEVPGKPAVMVTMKPDDPYQLVAIKKPSRGMKDGTLTDQRIEAAIESASKILESGKLALNKATPPVPDLKEYHIKKVGDVYNFVSKTSKQGIVWEELGSISADIPILKKTSITPTDTLKYSGDGIQNEAKERFEEFIGTFSTRVLRRLLSYINAYRSDIEIARLSRDGSGTAQLVAIEDIGACRILLVVCLLFPKALKRHPGYSSRFKVEYAPLLWEIRDVVRTNIVSRSTEEEVEGWPSVHDTAEREMREYQVDSVEEMLAKRDSGKKGHFIWIPAGLGKTLIAFNYLEGLIDKTMMSKYVIYALPESALASIITEIEYFGFDINLLLPIKGWKKHSHASYSKSQDTMLPLHINLINHDHMRRMSEELISKASESIFIIDEVHKALNDTIRTGVALEISRLSVDFVAMTGTPIIDSNTYKLIWWLEQIVDFEVNEKNFWVAANGMIAKKVNTGILVDKQDVLATMNPKEKKEYATLVPLAMGGINQRPSNKDINAAFELCYQVCDREMVVQTMEFLKKKKGVMLVVRNVSHQQRMLTMLISAGLRAKDIHVLDESIFMTDESVAAGDTPDYKVVIVPMRKSEGYTLTRMRAMVTSVYPSNNATREQLEGRINRVSQHAKEVHYRVIHTGILTYVMQRHKDAASLSAVLSAIAKEVEM